MSRTSMSYVAISTSQTCVIAIPEGKEMGRSRKEYVKTAKVFSNFDKT